MLGTKVLSGESILLPLLLAYANFPLFFFFTVQFYPLLFCSQLTFEVSLYIPNWYNDNLLLLINGLMGRIQANLMHCLWSTVQVH